MKRSLLVLLCCLLLVALLCACGQQPADDSSSDDQQAAAETKDTLVFGLSAEPVGLDPYTNTDQMSWANWIALYDLLFWYNDKTHEVENRLAESYSWDDTFTELTIKVKEGVYFHNGEEMTAEDAAFSVDRIATGPYTMMYIVNYDSVEVIDRYTFKIKYTAPYEGSLKCLCALNFAIVPKALVEADPEAFALNPIGTGPYKFVSRTSGVDIVYEANENYWRGEAPIKNLIFKIYTDVNTVVVALEAGEVDFLTHAPLTSKEQIASSENLIWDEADFNGPLIVNFQQGEGSLFSDINLRKAVQYAINREDILMGAANGCGSVQYGLMLPGMLAYEEDYTYAEHDIEKAKEYMRAAGYAEGEGPTITIPSMDTAIYYKAADIIASELSEIGFNVTVERVERAAYFDTVFSKNDFTLVTMGWGIQVPDDDFSYALMHSSQIGGGFNFSRIDDPTIDRLLDAGRTEPDQAKRIEIYKELKHYYDEQAVIIPLILYSAGVAYNKDLKGVEPDYLYRFNVYDYSW